MDEQILKDFIATAQANNYNWRVTIDKFPELQGYDWQLLKDYVATAEANNYNYAEVNAKFPEFNFTTTETVEGVDVGATTTMQEQVSGGPVKKKRGYSFNVGHYPRLSRRYGIQIGRCFIGFAAF